MNRNPLKRILEKQVYGVMERYRLEKALLGEHGPDAIKIYLLIDGKTASEKIIKKVGMKEARFLEIVKYMESIGMLKAEEGTPRELEEAKPTEPAVEAPPPPREQPVEASPELSELIEKPAEEPIQAKPKEEKPAEPVKPAEEKPVEPTPVVPELKEPPKPTRIPKTPLEKKLYDRFGDSGLVVDSLIDGFKTPNDILRQTKLNEQQLKEILEFMSREGMIKLDRIKEAMELPIIRAPPPEPKEVIPPIPLIKTEEFGKLEEKGSALEAMLVKEAALKKVEEKKPELQPPAPVQPPVKEPPKPTRIPKTPLEKKLYEKFGDAGLYAYSLIDEFKTPRDILRETKLNEQQLKEILEFMSREGIIKLERPHEVMERPVLKAPPVLVEAPPKPVEPPPKPVEIPPLILKPVERFEQRLVQPVVLNRTDVYLPTVSGIKLLTKLKLEAEILKRFGNEGVKVFSLMNGKKTNVRIVKDIRINPDKLDDIVSLLIERGVIKLQPLTAENIKELYGEEGYSIYNKYKRDGILLYELIDKKANLRDIVNASGIEPKLAVEIFSFIHKVLGLDIQIDTELLYKQLGIKPGK